MKVEKEKKAANLRSLPFGLYPRGYFARLLLVRHRQQELASGIATNQGDDARSLRADHTVVERAIRLGTSLRADRSAGRVELVRDKARCGNYASRGEVVTALAVAGAVGGQVV